MISFFSCNRNPFVAYSQSFEAKDESEAVLVFEARETLRLAIEAIDKMAKAIESTPMQVVAFQSHARRLATELRAVSDGYQDEIAAAKAA